MSRSWRTGCPVGRGCPACGVEAKARIAAAREAVEVAEMHDEPEPCTATDDCRCVLCVAALIDDGLDTLEAIARRGPGWSRS